jgi:hypothetical protein
MTELSGVFDGSYVEMRWFICAIKKTVLLTDIITLTKQWAAFVVKECRILKYTELL